MQKYPDGRIRTCQNHNFLEVSQPPSYGNELNGADKIADNVQEWLRRLVVRYGEREPPDK
jgi:hypothetical protein